MTETPQGLTPPTVQLASLPRQWRAEAKASDPAYGNGLRDCARELQEVLSISPRGCWEHPGVMGYRHPECGFCWHGKDGLDVPQEGRGANREPRCPRCALAEMENAVSWNTSCLSCARVLDSSIAEHERAERAEEKLAAIREDLPYRRIIASLVRQGGRQVFVYGTDIAYETGTLVMRETPDGYEFTVRDEPPGEQDPR